MSHATANNEGSDWSMYRKGMGGEGEEKYENHGGYFKTRTATGCESTSETRKMKFNYVTDP